MLLPPIDSPQRALSRAAEETKSLGLCMIGLGVIAGTCFIGNLMMLIGGGVYFLSLVLSCGAFGVFYVFAARMMRAGRAWAPTAILAVTGAQGMWVVGYLGWSAWRGRDRLVGALLLPSLLWLTALAVVAYYAVRGARAIRLLGFEERRGFEVPQSVLPVAAPDPSPQDITRTPNRET